MSSTTSSSVSPLWVDLLERIKGGHSGPQWAHECEDLNMTLLSWEPGKSVAPHVNNEVDVILIGVAGTGTVMVENEQHELRPGTLLLIAKGSQRSIESHDERFSYLSVHRRRRGLMPTYKGQPLT